MESGTKLGHYEIGTLLGKGGMGEVWRARDTKLGRDVAIKTLPEDLLSAWRDSNLKPSNDIDFTWLNEWLKTGEAIEN